MCVRASNPTHTRAHAKLSEQLCGQYFMEELEADRVLFNKKVCASDKASAAPIAPIRQITTG